jgi:hypothetical protein
MARLTTGASRLLGHVARRPAPKRRGAKLPKHGCAGAIDRLSTLISFVFERRLGA